MRQMAAVRKVEAEDGVSRREQRHEGSGVGLRARVRLNVDVISAEEAFRALASQILHDIGVFAASVVALAWVPFRVLVGEDSARGLQDRAADEVLTGDHLKALVLAHDLVLNLSGYLGIGGGKGCGKIDRHEDNLMPAARIYAASSTEAVFSR